MAYTGSKTTSAISVFGRDLRRELDRVRNSIITTRRHLHAHPELAFLEHQTSALIARRCQALGLIVRTGVGGTGVLADLDGSTPGSTVLVRADMDALPIRETDESRSYRSRVPGVMHACGHDGHVAVALAAAEILAKLRRHWAGRVRFCFQPAEEVDAGAERAIADGALDGVDKAVGLHLQADIHTGTIEVGAGAQWAASDHIELQIIGAGGHAGAPEQTINPIPIAAEIILELERCVHQRSSEPPAVLTIAQISGGTAANVSPERTTLRGTIRTFEARQRQILIDTARTVAQRVAENRGATVAFTLGAQCPAVVCDQDATARVQQALTAEFGEQRVLSSRPRTASDDMARYLRAVPGCYFRVGASNPAAAHVFPHHHPRFDLDEPALPIATHALTLATRALLG